MQNKEKIKLIEDYFNEILPQAGCELTYSSDYGLLIAVMLSAQCTDKKVNKVTHVLFSKYKTLKELDEAPLEDIESIIKFLGLYKNKAKNIKLITRRLINFYDGKVPSSKEELTTLAGVGNKTANVVRIEIFKEPEFPVDTHVKRISNRLGLVNEEDPDKIEQILRRKFPKDKWILLHHQMIHFGRYYCKAMNPMCENCKLKGICKDYKNH